VYSSSLIAPLRPWAFSNRPTLRLVLLEIVIYYVYAHLLAIGKSVNDGAQCFSGASVAPDYSAKVIRVNVYL
jgi:hypothetical protein